MLQGILPCALLSRDFPMDHTRWMREVFPTLAPSLGLGLTPGDEIARRLGQVRHLLTQQGIEAALVIHKLDLFYLSGTAQDGMLLLAPEKPPLLLVRRELERAARESPITDILPFRSLKELPRILREHLGALPGTLGLELDVLPTKDYLLFRDLFSGTPLLDISSLVRKVRRIKSPWEIAWMREAGRIGKAVYDAVPGLLRQGLTEIAFAGLLEAEAKREGDEGLLRVRSMNYEAYSWHVLSGWTGGMVSQSDSPMGGLGLSPAFPVGASRKPIGPGEPVLVDFGTCTHGYQADETRMFSLGPIPMKFREAYAACREIHDAVLSEVKPGADCEGLFLRSMKVAEALGFKEAYLGPPGLQCRFVAHGIGLELNEVPFLAMGHRYPLEAGMTFALEPKIVFPGEGAVGIENTVLVTETGCEILTPASQEFVEVPG